jgi:nucleoid DNA-binding protein
MDKPISTSVKDYLIKRMSVRLNIPSKTIEAIVAHQMEGINNAIQSDDKFSVEMSGFGKFLFNHKKAQKKYEKNLSKEKLFSSLLEDPNMTERQRASCTLKLENTRKWMEGIKPKLDKCPKLQNTSN